MSSKFDYFIKKIKEINNKNIIILYNKKIYLKVKKLLIFYLKIIYKINNNKYKINTII